MRWFRKGGYTGTSPRWDTAGIVHKGEAYLPVNETYAAYEADVSPAYPVSVGIAQDLEVQGVPWPVSGDATTLRGRRP